jgi:hypothetical protein
VLSSWRVMTSSPTRATGRPASFSEAVRLWEGSLESPDEVKMTRGSARSVAGARAVARTATAGKAGSGGGAGSSFKSVAASPPSAGLLAADELSGLIGGSAVGPGFSLTPGTAAGGSAGFNSGVGLLAGATAGTSSSDVPAGAFACLFGDPLAGGSGIAGIRSGSGPSNGSAVRFATGFLGPGVPASGAGIGDAGPLTTTPLGSAALGFGPADDESSGMFPGSVAIGPDETVRESGAGASPGMPGPGAGSAAGVGIAEDAVSDVGTWFSIDGIAATPAGAVGAGAAPVGCADDCGRPEATVGAAVAAPVFVANAGPGPPVDSGEPGETAPAAAGAGARPAQCGSSGLGMAV